MAGYTINNNLAISHLIELILTINSINILLLCLSIYTSNYHSFSYFNKIVKLAAPSSFLASFYLFLIIAYLFIYNNKWHTAFWTNDVVSYGSFFIFPQPFGFSLDFFGLVLIMLAYIVGFISLTCINDKLM